MTVTQVYNGSPKMAKDYMFVLLCLWVSLCNGLYFHIGETEQKCFIEEVPSETMIVGELVISGLLTS